MVTFFTKKLFIKEPEVSFDYFSFVDYQRDVIEVFW